MIDLMSSDISSECDRLKLLLEVQDFVREA